MLDQTVLPVQASLEIVSNTASIRLSESQITRSNTAIISSRLGRPVERFVEWFARLELQVFRARQKDSRLILVEGTTTYPWLKQAVDLYRPAAILLQPDQDQDRDALAIASADRVIALHVRSHGKIYKLLREHLERARGKADVWIAVDGEATRVAHDLMNMGAIGWYYKCHKQPAAPARRHLQGKKPLQGDERRCQIVTSVAVAKDSTGVSHATSIELPSAAATNQLSANDLDNSEWLIHCTRGRSGPMPGQTMDTWYREVLLQGRTGQAWNAAEVLEEIVRCRLIRGNSQRKGGSPVVCLSQVPLLKLLQRRTFRSHRGRWDYEPYGIAFRKSVLVSAGAEPVEYSSSEEIRKLSKHLDAAEALWRYQARGTTFDWQQEQEWRVLGHLNFEDFHKRDLFVFSADPLASERIRQLCEWPVYDFVLSSASGID